MDRKSAHIDRGEIQGLEFTVAAVIDQAEPWWLSQYVKEPEPWGFFAELVPSIPPLWSDHELVGLDAECTSPDGTALSMHATLRKRDERGRIVLFFPRQQSAGLPIGSKVRFVLIIRGLNGDA
jgi:hypothetical protein